MRSSRATFSARRQGYNDSVDFTGGNRPGPIVQFIDNVFLAAVDDCFDMDGTDAHIEGNIFMNVHQDAFRDSTANAVSTGRRRRQSLRTRGRAQHFLQLRSRAAAEGPGFGRCFENNTVVTIRDQPVLRTAAAYVQFGEPHRSVPRRARRSYERQHPVGPAQHDAVHLYFTNGTMFMVANDNIIQGTNMMFGGNSTNDPMFVNWQTGITHLNIKSNLALLAGLACDWHWPQRTRPRRIRAGWRIYFRRTRLARRPNTSATLTVAGPGVYAYRWKLNDGSWSAEVPLTNNFLITATMFSNAVPITLSGLTNGTYTVSVIGKNSAGFWQDTNSATVSKTWTVASRRTLMATACRTTGRRCTD